MIEYSKIEEFFAPEGLFQQNFPPFEIRTSQRDLARRITRTINEKRFLIAEAGTGVGKTFSYLVPAMLYADQEEQPLVISTYTKNLQMQLAQKDIPQVAQILDLNLEIAVLMGRSNYLCRTRLQFLHQKKEQFPVRLLPQIYLWAQETEEGTFEEWSFADHPEIWSLIAADADGCQGQFCPHQNDCFVQKARRKCQQADIIVINHHLFFSDLKMQNSEEQSLLPSHQVIIFDEAHHLEQTGIDFLGTDFSQVEVIEIIGEIRDFLGRLQKEKKDGLNFATLFSALQGLEEKAQAFFFEFDRELERNNPRFIYPGWWQKLQNSPLELLESMEALNRGLVVGEEVFPEELTLALGELRNRWGKLIASLDYFLDLPGDNFVSWLEGDGKNLILRSLPLFLDDFLIQSLYPQVESLIFTSATLSINDQGAYFAENLGLPSERTDTMILGSPFDYDQQAILLIPRDIPPPQDPDFVGKSIEIFQEVFPVLGPRNLLLFTSYQMLQSFYREIEGFCEEKGVEVFVQGKRAVSQLLRDFRESPRAIMLGTASFWEGVDLPGADLTSVILFRLPFPVPDDPWISGKARELEKQGKNSFTHLMLPRAIIRFKQGWGRLIRSFSDRGILLVLDRRILTKNYGKIFCSTLPERLPIIEGSAQKLFTAGKKFCERAGEIWTEVEK